MSLLFSGASSFAISGPEEWSQPSFDLDRLVIPFRGKVSDLETFLTSHPIGESLDGNMFLVGKNSDSDKQFPTVQLVYMGARNGNLPPQQHEFDTDILSASSRLSSTNIILTQPMVIEYYAPTSILNYYSFGAPGTQEADDPVADPLAIDLTSFDIAYIITPTAQASIDVFFSKQITSILKSVEIVPGQYWKNTAKKTKLYTPFLFAGLSSGPWITLGSPGVGYRVGDVLTISSGGQSATITVTSVLVLWGDQRYAGIYSFTVSADTFTVPHQLLQGYGGYGHGALFNVAIIP